MRFTLLRVLAITLSIASGTASAQTGGCDAPPNRNRPDFSLPCILHPPTLGVETQVYFDHQSAALTADARAILDRQAEVLVRYPSQKVTLYGHSDVAEEDAVALGRAKAVRDYLMARGVSAEQLAAASRGNRAVIPLKPSEETFAAMRFVSTEPR